MITRVFAVSSRNSITGPGTGQIDMAEVRDRLHDGVAVFDSDDNLIFANHVCRDLFRSIAENFTPGLKSPDHRASSAPCNI
ncbi:MAG TPA: hypothetical protein DIW51_02470 [Rhodospirillaceae bacterium]|nr:hypothetical protein [Rhodospirillaceae bacterium]HCS68815.1 hypothetical protein [Rhodospirillaceae bacterium]